MKRMILRIVPYNEIENLSSLGRIRKLLNIAKENKIVLLQGRLRSEEEEELIKTTMEEITPEFRGIEHSVINPEENARGLGRIRNFILGNRGGFTIIGPASIVKDIKKNPNKIELLMNESTRRKIKIKKNKSKLRRRR